MHEPGGKGATKGIAETDATRAVPMMMNLVIVGLIERLEREVY
jgi:hypothetical protein